MISYLYDWLAVDKSNLPCLFVDLYSNFSFIMHLFIYLFIYLFIRFYIGGRSNAKEMKKVSWEIHRSREIRYKVAFHRTIHTRNHIMLKVWKCFCNDTVWFGKKVTLTCFWQVISSHLHYPAIPFTSLLFLSLYFAFLLLTSLLFSNFTVFLSMVCVCVRWKGQQQRSWEGCRRKWKIPHSLHSLEAR